MKNIYPLIFTYILTHFFCKGFTKNTQNIEWNTLIVCDAQYTYDNSLDSLKVFIQKLFEDRTDRLSWTKSLREVDKLSKFHKIIIIGEASLIHMQEAESQLLQDFLQIDSLDQRSLLGLFFQEDYQLETDSTSWYHQLKHAMGRVEENLDTKNPQFQIASLEKDEFSFIELNKKYEYPSLMPGSQQKKNRVYMTYLSPGRTAFDFSQIQTAKENWISQYYEQILDWLEHDKEEIYLPAALMKIPLAQRPMRVEFSWADLPNEKGGEYFLEKDMGFGEWKLIKSWEFKPQNSELAMGDFKEEIQERGLYRYRIRKLLPAQGESYFSQTYILYLQPQRIDFSLWPNPVSKQLSINLQPSQKEEVQISIISHQSGQAFYQSSQAKHENTSINVEDLLPGLYHVRVKTEKSSGWRSFIKYD